MLSRKAPALIPAVSVLIPVYNAEIHLPECLNSVLSQTLEQIEIICINDGSTDSSLAIIEDVAKTDDRVRIINKLNTGYGDSLNKGIDLAKGEYLGIVEADDYIDKAMYDELFILAKAHSADIVKSNFFEQYNEKARLANIIPVRDAEQVITPFKRTEIFKSQPSVWSAIYRRAFLNEHSIRFLASPGASFQDTSFNLKTFAVADKAWLTRKAYVHYRRDNENSSIHSTEKVYCVRDEYEEFEKFLEKYPDRKQALIKLVQCLKFETYSWNLARLEGTARDEFYDFMHYTFLKLQTQDLLERDCFNPRDNELLTLLLTDDKKFITESIKYRGEKYAFNDI